MISTTPAGTSIPLTGTWFARVGLRPYELLGLTERQPPFCPPLFQGRQLCVEALSGWVADLRPHPAAPTSAPAPAAPHC